MTCEQLAEQLAALVLALPDHGAPEGLIVLGGVSPEALRVAIKAGIATRSGSYWIAPGPELPAVKAELTEALQRKGVAV